MEKVVIVILIVVAVGIAISWYKASKKKGTANGSGGTLPGPEPGKHTNDEDQVN